MEELDLTGAGRPVPALLLVPTGADWLLVLAHGAGAGMRHPFMDGIARRLGEHRVATLRYDYPYMAAGSRRPDPGPLLEQVTRDVVTWATARFPGLRVAAGGKSMGGRMTSQAQAAAPLPRVEALVFLGFPLHPAGRPGTARAEHLRRVAAPLLFLQGTRDALAGEGLIRGVCAELGERATLHVVEGADHGFTVPRRSGRTSADVLDALAGTTAAWLRLPAPSAAGP